MRCLWNDSILHSNCLGSFWESLVYALTHKICWIMKLLHHPIDAAKSAGSFTTNSGILTRLNILIWTAVRITIWPFSLDFWIQSTRLFSKTSNIGQRPHAVFFDFCILAISLCFFLPSRTCFSLTEKWQAAIELFDLSAKAITWSLKLAV